MLHARIAAFSLANNEFITFAPISETAFAPAPSKNHRWYRSSKLRVKHLRLCPILLARFVVTYSCEGYGDHLSRELCNIGQRKNKNPWMPSLEWRSSSAPVHAWCDDGPLSMLLDVRYRLFHCYDSNCYYWLDHSYSCLLARSMQIVWTFRTASWCLTSFGLLVSLRYW